MSDTPITPSEALILAGMFCVTNMGMDMPEQSSIARAIKNPPTNRRNASTFFGEQYMESEEHEEIFYEETKAWFTELSSMSWTSIEAIWPEAVKAYNSAKLSLT